MKTRRSSSASCEQWFLKITAYADELLDDMEQLEGGWPERVLTMQRNWIGRSRRHGSRFQARDRRQRTIRVFTTRIDTIYGATCVILAPGASAGRRSLVTDDDDRLQDQGDDRRRGAHRIRARSRSTASSPGATRSIRFSGEKVPIWVGNFVLMGYGTGAIMAVPAHDERDFEFCRKYGIPDSSGDSPGGRRARRNAVDA